MAVSQRLLGIAALLAVLVPPSSAAASRDEIICANTTGTVTFIVAGELRLRYKRPGASAKEEEITGPVANGRAPSEDGPPRFVIRPNGKPRVVKRRCEVQVIRGRAGKARCTGREISRVTFRQRVIIAGENEQSLFTTPYLPEDAIVTGRDGDALETEVICHHDIVTTTGGCGPTDDEHVTMRRAKCDEEDGIREQ